jgi:predicted DNA-binding antitoxin AbrB/MazE fold protein
MVNTITVIYENGALHPLTPLPLQERQKVQIQILPILESDQVKLALHKLATTGLLTPPTKQTAVTHLSEQERIDLANRLGRAATKPLSERIIEERGE